MDLLEIHWSCMFHCGRNGCQSRGSLFNRLTRPKLSHSFILLQKLILSKQFSNIKYFTSKNSSNYNYLYEDVNNSNNFQNWFKLINSDESFFNVGLDVPMYLSNGEKIGLMTRRFLKYIVITKLEMEKLLFSIN